VAGIGGHHATLYTAQAEHEQQLRATDRVVVRIAYVL
jgi:hypothetical protein